MEIYITAHIVCAVFVFTLLMNGATRSRPNRRTIRQENILGLFIATVILGIIVAPLFLPIWITLLALHGED